MGAALYEMLEGCPPFAHANRRVLFDRILAGRYVYRREHSKAATALIAALLTVNPEGRPTEADGIKQHPFFARVWSAEDWGVGLSKGWSPPFRPGPGSVLEHINPSFLAVPVDEEVAQSPPPAKGLLEFGDFTYNGDTTVDRGAATE